MELTRRVLLLASALVVSFLAGCAELDQEISPQQAAPAPVPFVRAEHLCANLETGKTDIAAIKKDLGVLLTNVPGNVFIATGQADYVKPGVESVTEEGIRVLGTTGFKFEQLMNTDFGYRVKAAPAGYPQGVQLWNVLALFFVDKDLTQCVFDEVKFIQQDMRQKYVDREMGNFPRLVAEYRAMETKPKVTEDQRRFIVQANSWTEKKRYDMAIDMYLKALQLNQISYPAGYYNLGLLYAQEGDYMAAIVCMKKYLLLVPEAGDARIAQDKIYEWEGAAGVR
jgi:tetratricopeptide (TPR) repeat protein